MMLCPFSSVAAKAGDIRRINIHNPRTDERLDEIYYVHGEYVDEVMHEINTIMRDIRADEATQMDLRLVDIMSATQYLLGHDRPFSVISGYRSQQTNDMLRRRSRGVAKKSYHIKGMAVDLRMKDVSVERIRSVGERLNSGGVGIYTRSNFVHLDSGPVRQWGS